jgi:Asp-tRNA(Asn)/Glu-tRNA(Gln) amidotransferase A subunit family amidase
MSAGLAALAMGTDGGGSIRIPAALTGVFGFKPSTGRWPVFPASGVGPLSHSGPITRNVSDAGLLFRTLAGPDDRDCYSAPFELFPDQVNPMENLRIGWSPDLGFMRVDKQVRDIVEAAVHRFEAAGCTVVETKVEIGDPTPAVAVYFAAGSAAAISRYPDWQNIVDPGLRELIQSYSRLTAVDFAAAQLYRAEICSKISSLYSGIDLLATPTTPMPAFRLGMDGPGLIDGEEVDNIRWLGLTSAFNLTGQPAASMPAGFTSDGLPVGLQLVGPRFQDWLVLRASKTFEQISKWPTIWPNIAAI